MFPYFESLAFWFNHAIPGAIEIREFHLVKFVHFDPPFILRQGHFISILSFIDRLNSHKKRLLLFIANKFLIAFVIVFSSAFPVENASRGFRNHIVSLYHRYLAVALVRYSPMLSNISCASATYILFTFGGFSSLLFSPAFARGFSSYFSVFLLR